MQKASRTTRTARPWPPERRRRLLRWWPRVGGAHLLQSGLLYLADSLRADPHRFAELSQRELLALDAIAGLDDSSLPLTQLLQQPRNFCRDHPYAELLVRLLGLRVA